MVSISSQRAKIAFIARTISRMRRAGFKIRRERIEDLRKTELGARALQNVDEAELDSLDADKLMEMQREQLEKERRELTERIRRQRGLQRRRRGARRRS